AERYHSVAHGSQVDDSRNAGKVLHQDARRTIGDLAFDGALVAEPFGDRQNMFLGDRASVFMAQQVLKQDLHREGELRNAGKAVRLRLGKTIIDIVLATHGKDGTTIEAVERFSHGKTPR